MTRAPARTRLHNDSLVRFLTECALLAPAQPSNDVGQKLGNWLDFRHAIALKGLLDASDLTGPLAPALQRRVQIAPETLTQNVNKVRAQLALSITQGTATGSGLARIDMPEPMLHKTVDLKTVFEPYRRFLGAHQRQMESTLRSLRTQLRLQLSQRGGASQLLAALDGAFESILAKREAVLLSKTCKLLERQFIQGLKLRMQTPNGAEPTQHHADSALSERQKIGSHQAADPPADLPASKLTLDGHSVWLTAMYQTLRQALLAELETRLQPTLGLLEALTCQTSQNQ